MLGRLQTRARRRLLKEHRKVEEQGAEIAELRSALDKQAAQIQKVSDQLKTQALAPRVVANN